MFIVKLFKKLIGLIIGVVVVVLVIDFFLTDDDSIVSTVVEGVSDITEDIFDSGYDDYDYDDYDYDYDDDDYYSHSNHHGNQNHYVGYEDDDDYGYQNHSYSDYDNYDDDSWEVMDYLFSFIGDDYGYDNYDYSDYDHYYNYDDYYNDYQYDYDYDYEDDDYEYDDDDYYGEKPSITTNSSGNNSQTQSVTPVSISTQRQRFIEYALSLKGTPYLYGGKTPSPGIDCSGLVAFAARKAISVNFTGSAQMMYDAANNINISSAEPGDLLFFSDTGNGITHVGIFLGKNSGQGASNQRMMVHSASDGASTGVIVSSIDQSNYWSKHLVGAKSFLSSSSEVRNITRSKNKKSIKSSSESDFENDSWWDDVDASWFD